MSRTALSGRSWLFIPLLALALAASCAFASAAFADTLTALQEKALIAQAGEATAATTDTSEGQEGTETKYEEPDDFWGGVGADINRAKIDWTGGSSFAYTGKEIEPAFKVTLDGKVLKGTDDFQDQSKDIDFYYYFDNNVKVSKGKKLEDEDKPVLVVATFTEGEPYVYVKTKFFTIKPASIKKATAKVAKQTYTGNKLKPLPSVKYNGMTLRKGTDYTVTYKNNVKVGTKAQVIIKGKGNFSGTLKAKFTIKKATIANATFSKVKDKTFTGNSIKPEVTVKLKGKKLKKNKDYTISYKNNRNAGIATIKIKGKDNLKGSHTIQFAITPRSINKIASASISSATWTGSALYPKPRLRFNGGTLQEGRDYTLSYDDNVDVGTGYVYVNAMGNYAGSRTLKFSINRRSVKNDVQAWFRFNTYWYSPNLRPYPVVVYNGRMLVHGIDYELSNPYNTYDPTTKKGSGSVTIYGKGHFTDQRTLYYNIIGS